MRLISSSAYSPAGRGKNGAPKQVEKVDLDAAAATHFGRAHQCGVTDRKW